MTAEAVTSSAQPELQHARLTLRRSDERGHADHGWLNSYHSFSFADYWDPKHMSWGSVRVLNEDRVAPGTGFPTHPHRDAEIFSYIVSGELTHRDSMIKPGAEGSVSSADFYRMRRGDVQFTTGGSGIAHSEQNEHRGEWVHFLQIWALPWKKGLTPRYHTKTFDEADKRKRIVPILSPLKAGVSATDSQEAEAQPTLDETIPVHADLLFGATVIPKGDGRDYNIGGSTYSDEGKTLVAKAERRKAYVHLIMTSGSKGQAQIRLDGRVDLSEGDGCYLDGLTAGDKLRVENIGSVDAELVLLDSDG